MNPLIMLICLLIFLGPCEAASADIKTYSIESKGARAQVVLVRGSATLFQKGISTPYLLSEGDFFITGDRVETAEDSKIALKFPGRFYMRFGPETSFELVSVGLDANKRQHIQVRVIRGRAWANFAAVPDENVRFIVSARATIVGVPGAVYLVRILKDTTTVVKVFQGDVGLKSPPLPEKTDSDKTKLTHFSAEKRQWYHILKQNQQVVVRPDGTATKPFRFAVRAESNGWIDWNRNQDEMIER